PFVLLLLDVWPLRRLTFPLDAALVRARLREKLPLFAIALVSSVVTFLVQHAAGAVMTSQSLGVGARLKNALASYARYLGVELWPHDLAAYYPLTGRTPLVLWLGALAILVLCTWLAWRARARHPALLVGWLWFVGTLVPVIGFVQV